MARHTHLPLLTTTVNGCLTRRARGKVISLASQAYAHFATSRAVRLHARKRRRNEHVRGGALAGTSTSSSGSSISSPVQAGEQRMSSHSEHGGRLTREASKSYCAEAEVADSCYGTSVRVIVVTAKL